jgi:hypothetical protein
VTKLLFVVLHEKSQRLEAVVEDASGRKRRVEMGWLSRDMMPVPSTWFETVEGELVLQDTEAAARAKGRVLF